MATDQVATVNENFRREPAGRTLNAGRQGISHAAWNTVVPTLRGMRIIG